MDGCCIAAHCARAHLLTIVTTQNVSPATTGMCPKRRRSRASRARNYTNIFVGQLVRQSHCRKTNQLTANQSSVCFPAIRPGEYSPEAGNRNGWARFDVPFWGWCLTDLPYTIAVLKFSTKLR